jgi:hypothetical protein
MEKPSIFSEKTLIPASVLSVIFGGAMWLTTIWVKGEANAAEIAEFKDTVWKKLDRIEDKLDRIIEKKGF